MILVIGNGPFTSSLDETYWAPLAAVLERRKYEVKVTTDIIVSDHNPLADARKWISKNCLRRLEGQDIKIICAMGAEGRCDLSWVLVMDLVFGSRSGAVAAVLQREYLRREAPLHDFFSDLAGSEVWETIDDACGPDLECIIDRLKPFTIAINPVDENLITNAWSSEKVILFGRTGSGKSTIAQMLTLGRLDPSGINFKASSSARGVTSDIQRGEGRGWHVTDTPGFGEAKKGTVTTEQATDIVKRFIKHTCGTYSHYLYVVKKDRVDVCDERLWQFFKKVFNEAEDNFSVVVTGCQTLPPEEVEYMKTKFAGCQITCVNFPPTETGDNSLEEETQEEREESLENLEDALAGLGVAESHCREGRFSKETFRFCNSEFRALFGTSFLAKFAADTVVFLLIKPVAALARSLLKSEKDESFYLLPQ